MASGARGGLAVPRRCTVCDSPKHAEIDRALVSRAAPFRTIAHQYRVTRDALMRHDAEHLPATLAKAQGAREVTTADKLLERLTALHGITLNLPRGNGRGV